MMIVNSTVAPTDGSSRNQFCNCNPQEPPLLRPLPMHFLLWSPIIRRPFLGQSISPSSVVGELQPLRLCSPWWPLHLLSLVYGLLSRWLVFVVFLLQFRAVVVVQVVVAEVFEEGFKSRVCSIGPICQSVYVRFPISPSLNEPFCDGHDCNARPRITAQLECWWQQCRTSTQSEWQYLKWEIGKIINWGRRERESWWTARDRKIFRYQEVVQDNRYPRIGGSINSMMSNCRNIPECLGFSSIHHNSQNIFDVSNRQT